mmetsp:Transcript_70489/g.168822  ORF Transcript_70489/g.168822 Transcript_70489/m.168822 type:complete len:207 (+) Transcript_70489:934-1554(+)
MMSSSFPISSVRSEMSPSLPWSSEETRPCSLAHHSLEATSFSPSLVITASILSISDRTTLNGFPARSNEAILLTLSVWRDDTCSSTVTAFARMAACLGSGWCARMERSCRKSAGPSVAPVFVADTLPKVAKAASELRIEMASAMAASSLARRVFRSSYSLAFVSHMGTSCAKKSSSLCFCASKVAYCSFLADRSPSLAESSACFAS